MKHKIFTMLFLIICLIPSTGMLLLPPTEAAANEHLAPAPGLCTAEGQWNTAFLDEVTAYFADHFALRQELVTANAVLHTRLFRSSPVEDVIYGKNGWLYYAETLSDYQHSASLTGSEARRLAQTVRMMQEFCQGRGARFLFTIAPNKNSLYPQNMPARYLKKDAFDAFNALNNYQLILPYLEQYEVNYADLFSFFSAQDSVLYLKTDSHWTNRGAALTHDFLMETLGLPFTGFAEAPYTEKRIQRGDLYGMLYPKGTEMEWQQQYTLAFTHVRPPRSAEDILIETTKENAANGRLLFFRDSFGNALYPFLAEDFLQAVITRQMPYPLAQVQAGDTVIVEIVERNLPNLLKYPPDFGNGDEISAVKK